MNTLPELVESQRQQFLTVRSDKSMDFDREAGFALQILRGSDYLAKVAMGNKDSLYAAITNVAAIGISLNPATKLAYLVPRKNAICLDISYMGLLDIAQSEGAIRWGQAVVVREKDVFELQGIDKEPKHVYQPFGDRGKIIGVYAVVKTPDGDYLTHSMPLQKVYDIRDRSEAWKAYKSKGTTCPWATDEEEMIKKTCVKQASKYWPKSARLDEAIHHMNTDGGEGITTVKPNAMPDDEKQAWKARIEKETTKDGAKARWKEALAICEELGDVATAEWLKDVLVKHGEFIDRANKVAA